MAPNTLDKAQLEAPGQLDGTGLPTELGPENSKLFKEWADAVVADDDAKAERLQRMVLFTPGALRATKSAMGADFIRQEGFRTDLADREYGPGWMDK